MLDFNMAPWRPTRKNISLWRWVDGVLYPFGYGLSYTEFELKEAKGQEQRIVIENSTSIETVNFSVENKGSRDGDTVVMGFFTPEKFSTPGDELALALKYELFTFERVSLKAGESIDMRYGIGAETLMVYDENGDGVLIPGEYTITITEGGINDPKALKIHVTVSGTEEKKSFNPS